MGRINPRGVLIGGLVAGAVLNVIDYLAYAVVFATDFPMPTATVMGIPPLPWFILVDFCYGIVLVYLYAAIRPRFGPGPRTAVIAGLLFWILVGLLHTMSEIPLGFAPHRIYLIGTLISLIAAPLSALLGARFYTET